MRGSNTVGYIEIILALIKMVSLSVNPSELRADTQLRQSMIRLMFCSGREHLVNYQPVDTRLIIVALHLGSGLFSTPNDVTQSFIDIGLVSNHCNLDTEKESDSEDSRMQAKTAAEFMMMEFYMMMVVMVEIM